MMEIKKSQKYGEMASLDCFQYRCAPEGSIIMQDFNLALTKQFLLGLGNIHNYLVSVRAKHYVLKLNLNVQQKSNLTLLQLFLHNKSLLQKYQVLCSDTFPRTVIPGQFPPSPGSCLPQEEEAYSTMVSSNMTFKAHILQFLLYKPY